MKKKWILLMTASAVCMSLFTGCGTNNKPSLEEAQSQTEQGTESSKAGDSVIVAMGPSSEPEAGFDRAVGSCGRGSKPQ